MRLLKLIIKRQYFDEILSGKKKNEYRIINPFLPKRYCEVGKNGVLTPRNFDAIQFYVGYNKNRASAIVEIVGAKIEFIKTVESEGEMIEVYQMNYELGKVLDVINV